MPASIIFDAETGKAEQNIDALASSTKRVKLSSEQAQLAIQKMCADAVVQAQRMGATFETQQKLITRGAQAYAGVTDITSDKVVKAYERQTQKINATAAAIERLQKIIGGMPSAGSGTHGTGLSQIQMAQALNRTLATGSSLRTGEYFMTMIPGFSKLASIAFPIAGAVAFTAEIARGVNAVKQMYDEMEQLPEVIKSSLDQIDLASNKTFTRMKEKALSLQGQIDALTGDHLGALRDELSLIDMQSMDNLSSAFEGLEKVADDSFKSIKESFLTNVVALATTGNFFAPGSSGVSAQMARIQNMYEDKLYGQHDKTAAEGFMRQESMQMRAQYSAANEYLSLTHRIGSGNYSLQDSARYDQLRKQLQGYSINPRDVDASLIGALRVASETLRRQVAQMDASNASTAMQKRLAVLRSNISGAGSSSSSSSLERQSAQASFEGLQQLLEAGKSAGRYQTPSQVQDFWANSTGRKGLLGAPVSPNQSLQDMVRKQWSEAGAEIQRQLASATTELAKWSQELDAQGIKKLQQEARDAQQLSAELTRHLQEVNAAQDRQSTSQAQNMARIQETRIQIAEMTGAMSRYDASVQLADVHSAAYVAQLGALKKALANAAPGSPEAINTQTEIYKVQADRQIQIQKDAAAVAQEAWQNAARASMAVWVQNSTDAARQLSNIFPEALDSVDSSLASSLTADEPNGRMYRMNLRRNLSGSLRGVGANLANMGLHGIEGSLFKGFGIGGKPDGTANNPLHVVMGGGASASSGIGGLLGGLFHHGSSAGLDGTAALDNSIAGVRIGGGGLFSKLGGMAGSIFSSIFGGGKAIGGGVSAGTTYLVGEKGPELFQPRSAGNIIPNHALNGNTAYYNVQVANGVTPEQMNMYMRATLQKYHPHVVRASVNAMIEHGKRIPKPSR